MEEIHIPEPNDAPAKYLEREEYKGVI
jgi:hypothetical protein